MIREIQLPYSLCKRIKNLNPPHAMAMRAGVSKVSVSQPPYIPCQALRKASNTDRDNSYRDELGHSCSREPFSLPVVEKARSNKLLDALLAMLSSTV